MKTRTTMSVILSALLCGCALVPSSNPITVSQARALGPSDFVRVEGGQFTLDGRPYRYVGANIWYAAYLGAAGPTGDRERLIAELDLLKENGVTNLRILGASEASRLTNAIAPAFQNRDCEYDEDLFVGLDYVLAEMATRDMKAVIYLNNFWEWSGGMTAYMEWDEGKSQIPTASEGWWPAYPRLAAGFYSSEKANQRFQTFIDRLLSRTNTLNGRRYSDDPTIMAWQLANEPRPGADDAAAAANLPEFYNWIATTSAFIKQKAPHQLVSTGNEGIMGCIGRRDCFVEAHGIENVDYLTFHMWPKNWRWIDTSRMDETFPDALGSAKTYVAQHIALAEELQKPIVLEEFGLERDGGGVSPDSTTRLRNRFYESIFGLIEQDARACGTFAGTNFWAWGGTGRAQHADAVWINGDAAFTGDPPQEPQGLNSVFDTDHETLSTVRQHSRKLSRLNATC